MRMGRFLCVLALGLLFVKACGTTRTAEKPKLAGWENPSSRAAPPSKGLYGAEEALRDALSGPLEYLGTGPWPGNRRMPACVFRNARVLVVNGYCGVKDTQAMRVDVFSPTRGRVRIYAESKAPVSAHLRPDYFTFTAESEPLPAPGQGLAPLHLQMSFAELRDYDERRYNAYLPACHAGTEIRQKKSGCLGPLAPQVGSFTKRNQAFLDRANDDWYRVVRSLRGLAEVHGKDPE
jgi:hypothetical protein